MKAWKMFEKEVAEYFGGIRRVRVRYDESIGDIIHPVYSIECKWGKQVPKYLSYNVPYYIKSGKKSYLVSPSSTCHIISSVVFPVVRVKSCKFLECAMNQAKKYNPALIPVVCVKPKGMRGFNIVL